MPTAGLVSIKLLQKKAASQNGPEMNTSHAMLLSFVIVLQSCDETAVDKFDGNSPSFLNESPTDLDNVMISLMKSRYCSRKLTNISDHVTWS